MYTYQGCWLLLYVESIWPRYLSIIYIWMPHCSFHSLGAISKWAIGKILWIYQCENREEQLESPTAVLSLFSSKEKEKYLKNGERWRSKFEMFTIWLDNTESESQNQSNQVEFDGKKLFSSAFSWKINCFRKWNI